jgi:broad specificity phosphatase PhoE
MSLLYLVRHGQASFFAENYDKLSPLGELQARRLGEYFAAQGIRFDAVVSGPAERQVRTAQIVVKALVDAGCSCPEPSIVEGFKEHSGDKLLSRSHAAAFFERHPELHPLEVAFREAREPEDVHRTFQKLFEAILHRWTAGSPPIAGVESWPEFQGRARGAFDAIVNDPRRRRTVLAVSSAGPISVVLQDVLHTSTAVSLDLGWRLRNASITTFIYTQGRVTLDAFNSLPHLANPAEVSYR